MAIGTRTFPISLWLFASYWQPGSAANCSAGEYATDEECFKCSPGSVQPLAGNFTECDVCSAGQWAPSEGMTACYECPEQSDSQAGSSSCLYNPGCSSCTERSSVKIRVVVHGLETNEFWMRARRGMVTAATQLNIDFDYYPLKRSSWQVLADTIDEVVAEDQPDALIVTLTGDVVNEAATRAAQQTEVFTMNCGEDVAVEVGSRGHFGSDEVASGYQAIDYFQSTFNNRGMTTGVCQVVRYATVTSGLQARIDGFAQGCQEKGVEILDDIVISFSDVSAKQTSIEEAIQSHLDARDSTTGLGLLLLEESMFAPAVAAMKAVGTPANAVFGIYDLPSGLDEGLSEGYMSFAIDQQEWMQGYMAVVVAAMYVTTGYKMGIDHYRTGPRFWTEPRTEAEALRHVESFPVCDCPWVSGYESLLECGPDVEGISAIGDCPLLDGTCTSPCLDMRKFSVAGVSHGVETDPFWFAVKGGAEQAANDLRLINLTWDLFKRAGLNSDDSYTDERLVEKLEAAAKDDSVDGVFCTAKTDSLYDAITLSASKKPTVTINVGANVSESLNPSGGMLLHHVGQTEYDAGVMAGTRLYELGVRHLACLQFDLTHDGHNARCRGAEDVMVAGGGELIWLDMNALGASERSDEEVVAALEVALVATPSIDGFLVMGESSLQASLQAAVEATDGGHTIQVGCFDVSEEGVEATGLGELAFMVEQAQYLQGYMSVLALAMYHMSGQALIDHHLETGPKLVTSVPSGVLECLTTAWEEDVVGEKLMPTIDTDYVYGFPVCEREGACTTAGTYFNTSLAECVACPAGSYRTLSMYQCELCPSGTATQGTTGSSSCETCNVGLYSLEGDASCSYCPMGSYSNYRGRSECTQCRSPFTTEHIATHTETMCMCPEGYYGTNGSYAAGGSCRLCPEAMTCPFGSHEDYRAGTAEETQARQFPSVDSGYMTLAEEPLQPYLCLETAACPGGETATCGAHRDPTTVACAVCQEGFYLDDTECRECDSSSLWVLVLLAIIALIGTVAVTLLSTTGSHMRSQTSVIIIILASLMLTNYQALSVFEQLAFSWFEPIASILAWSSNILSVDVQLVKLQCYFHFETWIKFALLQLVVPVGVPLVVLILYIKKHCPIRRFRTPDSDIALEAVTTVGSLLGMWFIQIVMATLGPFVCYQHPGSSGLSSVKSNPEVLCSWSDDHALMAVEGILSFLLVPLPFLANAVYVTWRYRGSLTYEARKTALNKYRYLFFRFDAHAYYYGLILMVRSLGICMVPVLVRDDAGTQIFVLAVFVAFTAQLQTFLQPWRAWICNLLDAAMSLLLLALLVSAALVSDFSANHAPLKVFGFVALVSMAVLGLATLAYVLYRIARRSPFYDMFLCHHKEGAAAQVRYIKTVLAAQRYSVFIDSDDLVNLDGLFDIVRNHVGCFVTYLTRSTLRRAWCCGEIVSAKQAKVKVRTVFSSNFVAPTETQLSNLESYIVGEDAVLAHYGISLDDVRVAMEYVLKPELAAVHLHQCPHPGSHKFVWAAYHLLRRTYSPATTPEHVEPTVLVSSSSTDDEAMAAAGFIVVKLHTLLMQRSFDGSVRCLNDETDIADLDSWIQQARAFVILLSSSTLSSVRELQVIVESVYQAEQRGGDSFSFIPVHLAEFTFPSADFFEVGLPDVLAQDGSGVDMVELTSSMKSFFKCISVQFPVGASEDVLIAQVQTIFSRVPLTMTKTSTLTGKTSSRKSYERLALRSSITTMSTQTKRASRTDSKDGFAPTTSTSADHLKCAVQEAPDLGLNGAPLVDGFLRNGADTQISSV